MNAPAFDKSYELEHRYTRESGRVYLAGVQALVRLPLMQRRLDRVRGWNSAGFISGYRGSPLGTYDMALWQASALLEAHQVRFEPGLNEDLAATAVWGSQQATLQPEARVEGVFGIWYGKGPGVDRSIDAIKHGNYMGTAARGGVLALMGDDPGAKSSSIAHQSEYAMVHCGAPVLNPASVQEYLDLGLHGFALSRFSGCWVGFKCLTDTVDSASSVEVDAKRVQIKTPDFEFPQRDHHVSMVNRLVQTEEQLYRVKLPAAQAYVRANGLDRVMFGAAKPRLGIITTGKSYHDLCEALEQLGIDQARSKALGIAVYKVAMPWPLEPQGVRDFCRGLEDVLVVEEKRPLIEEQVAPLLYNESERPRLLGKQDERGAPLLPATGELAPQQIAEALRAWLMRRLPKDAGLAPAQAPPARSAAAAVAGGLSRLPTFCSGCPHNRSTLVPEGSRAMGGIGCHGMATWMPERNTFGATHMGGEGANWIGQAPFIDMPHIFQNMGDGTYFHSGLLSVRACVAADVNITFKVLVNGAVAMTGGQPIEGEALEGEITAPRITAQLIAEGVRKVVVVSNEPEKYAAGVFPRGVAVHHRDRVIGVQQELRDTSGVTALVYDHTCAAEARRLRRQGRFPDPERRVVINELLCEGCGDCSVQSNCISIEPVETEFGRKRRIDQSSCNKDYSCLRGHCPCFVTVRGGRLRRGAQANGAADAVVSEPGAFNAAGGVSGTDVSGAAGVASAAGSAGGAVGGVSTAHASDAAGASDAARAAGGADVSDAADATAGQSAAYFADLPEPDAPGLARPWNVLVAGIGGTGVVTVGAVLSMAAHLEGKGVSELDVTGLAQKNGPVSSHVRIAADPERLHAVRIGPHRADLVLGCDPVVTTDAAHLPLLGPDTTLVMNTHVTPTFEFAADADLDLSHERMAEAAREACGADKLYLVDARRAALSLMGDAVYANMFLLGVACQLGMLPVGLGALERALELNGRSIAENRAALNWGRLWAHNRKAVEAALRARRIGPGPTFDPTLDELVEKRVRFLGDYQDTFYAERYRRLVERVRERERKVGGGGDVLARAVARYYFKVLAIKDEFEVARLYSGAAFREQIEREFEGDYTLTLHLASDHLFTPLFARYDKDSGRARKVAVPARWMMPVFRLMARAKFLRGTPLNPFGYRAHRRLERRLVREYERNVEEVLDGLTPGNVELAADIASLPEQVRGFDSVKETQLAAVRAKERELLEHFRRSG